MIKRFFYGKKQEERLRDQWKYLGFPSAEFDAMLSEMEMGKPRVERTFAKDIGADKMIVTPLMKRNDKIGNYFLDNYRAVVEKEVHIPPINLRGIDLKDLDLEMSKIGWNKVLADPVNLHDLYEDEIRERHQRQAIVQKLDNLALHSTEASLDGLERLMVKHFRGTVMAETVPGFEKMASKQQYQVSDNIPTTYTESYTLKKAYNLMMGRGVYSEIRPNEQMIAKAKENDLKEPYYAWVMLDLSVKKDNGEHLRKYYYKQTKEQLKGNGPIFDVTAKVAEMPVIDRDNPVTFGRIVDSLYKGNITQVFFRGEEKLLEHTFETNLRSRSLTVRNEEGKIVSHKSFGKETEKEKTSIIAKHYDEYLKQKKTENPQQQEIRQPKQQVRVNSRDQGLGLQQ